MQEGNKVEEVYHDMQVDDEEVIEIDEEVISPPPVVRAISSRDIARADDVPRPAMNIKPKRYDGNSDWKEYLLHFERVCEVNRWTVSCKVNYMMVLLDGDALSYAENLPEAKRDDFEKLCIAMDERFGDCLFTEVYKTELKTRRRKESESIPSLAQAIRKLTLQAYPNLDWVPREDLAVEYFIGAIDDREIRMALHQRQPRTTLEAVKIAVDLEAWKTAETKSRFAAGRVCQAVRGEVATTQQAIDKLTAIVDDLNKKIDNISRNKSPKSVIIVEKLDISPVTALIRRKNREKEVFLVRDPPRGREGKGMV